VLIGDAFAGEPAGPVTRIVVSDPYRALLTAVSALYPTEPVPTGIDPTARLGAGTTLGADVAIGPFVVLGRQARVGARTRLGPGVMIGDGVSVGEDCELGPHAVCYPGSEIGRRVVIKACAVIGGIGFGYAATPAGHTRIPHVGRCVLEDDTEIGSNTCIDRGSIDDTVIGRGTKIDNAVHIGHNVRIGERCLVMATTGIAGSAHIGNDVIIAGGVGIADHITIGDRARLSAKSVVMGNVAPGATIGGYPARGHRDFLRAQAALYRTTAMIDQLESIVQERSERAQTND
jgi:UDP-3-O-[3-hydroxymyristoyl] glucosamine N-acyltransferase